MKQSSNNIEMLANLSKAKKLLAIVLTTSIIASFFYVYISKVIFEDNYKKIVLYNAEILASALPMDLVLKLSANISDTNICAYKELKNYLSKIKETKKEFRFIYLWTYRDGELVFLVDSESPDSPNCSEPGDVYHEATASDKISFTEQRSVVSGPSGDKWGLWMSSLVPLRDSTGKVFAALGMDISVESWNWKIANSTVIPIIVSILVNLLIIGFYLLFRRATIARYKIYASERASLVVENKYRTIIENIKNIFLVVDRDNKICDISNSAVSELGLRSIYDVLAKDFSELWDDKSSFDIFFNKLKSCEGIEDYEFLCTSEDGKKTSVVATLYIVRDEKGEYDGYEGILRNISVRKQIEFELKESEEKFKKLFTRSNDPMLLINSKCITDANKAFVELVGSSSESEIIGKRALDISPEFQFPSLSSKSLVKELLRDGLERGAIVFEWKMKKQNGEIFPCEISMTTIEKGKDYTLFIICRDITIRKVAESEIQDYTSKLQNESRMLNSFIGLNPISIEILDSRGFPVKVNKAYVDLFGEAPAKDYNIFNDPSLIRNGIVDCIERVKKGETVYLQEFEYSRKSAYQFLGNNSIFIKLVAFPLINKKNELESIVLMHQNISEQRNAEIALRESEEKYKLIVDFNRDSIFILIDSEIAFVNNSFIEVSGYSEEELIGMNLRMIVHRKDLEIVKEFYDQKASKEPDASTLEFRFICKNKREIHVNCASAQIKYNGANAQLSALRDVTEEKVAQIEKDMLVEKLKYYNLQIESALSEKDALIDELNEIKESLMMSNLEKDKFFSIIAHDLRSPFSGFLNLTRTLSESLLDFSLTEMQEFVKDLQEQATHLYKLLENLLEWAKIQRGGVSCNPDVYDLKMVVNNIIEISRINAEQKDLELLNSIPLKINIYADLNMLHTALRNLISNAMKFTRRGGSITLFAEKKERLVEISVIDTGIGMDESTIEKLFRIDQKVSKLGTEGEASSGLGLLLCKEFIEKNNGKIWVESELGVGSKFIFTLPISQ